MSERRADHIRETLEQMIATGAFSDGERLDEMRLADRFAVSRTPLREALQSLAASGLVELIPRRGAFVRIPGLVDMVEMFEVMAELEAMCGRLAARRITDQQLEQLAQAAEACDGALEADDTNDYYRQNERFHNILYDASGNKFLSAEARRLHKRLQPFRRMQLLLRGRMAQSMKEHRAILDAVKVGDAELASEALRSHVAIQGERFNDLMASYNSNAVQSTG